MIRYSIAMAVVAWLLLGGVLGCSENRERLRLNIPPSEVRLILAYERGFAADGLTCSNIDEALGHDSGDTEVRTVLGEVQWTDQAAGQTAAYIISLYDYNVRDQAVAAIAAHRPAMIVVMAERPEYASAAKALVAEFERVGVNASLATVAVPPG